MSAIPRTTDAYGEYTCAQVADLAGGVIQVTLGTDGGPLVWGAVPHRELPRLFFELAQDTSLRAIVLTGSGEAFCNRVDFASLAHCTTAEAWHAMMNEGKQLLGNLLRIEAPIIAAVNGPATVHAELALLSDLVIASDDAVFQDSPHLPAGIVPGDGVVAIWSMLLGPNRGRAFLLTGEKISAADAKAAGLIAEMHPREQLVERARELAARLAKRPALVTRHTRILFTRQFLSVLERDLGYGLALEALAVLGSS
jgi:enoyl-CoA hydratase/carnithine racemase